MALKYANGYFVIMTGNDSNSHFVFIMSGTVAVCVKSTHACKCNEITTNAVCRDNYICYSPAWKKVHCNIILSCTSACIMHVKIYYFACWQWEVLLSTILALRASLHAMTEVALLEANVATLYRSALMAAMKYSVVITMIHLEICLLFSCCPPPFPKTKIIVNDRKKE